VIRTETYCGGRLVKEIDQVDVMSAETLRHEYIDGYHRWLLDGAEITEARALELVRDQPHGAE
jgi:hypothetical protein